MLRAQWGSQLERAQRQRRDDRDSCAAVASDEAASYDLALCVRRCCRPSGSRPTRAAQQAILEAAWFFAAALQQSDRWTLEDACVRREE